MTPGSNGASTPEDDDPFGYLYADGQANGAQPPSGGYGYPNSVNRVRPVGTRQYGQQGPAAQAPKQQGTYGQPNANYAAPETLPGAAPTASSQLPGNRGGHGGGGRGRGPNTKGLLIGAVAVVAAVVIGISVAMIGGDDDKDDKSGNQADASPTQSQTSEPSPSATNEEAPDDEAGLPALDAKALRLDGGTVQASEIKGAKAEGGVYVAGFNKVGAKVTWTVDGIKESERYRLYVRYGIPGVDADATLVVNGKADSRPFGLKNFGNLPEGDWEKGWQTSWANVNLNKGTNTIELVCNEGNQCNANLDQFWLTEEPPS
ncbi:carbohydrate-binding protein [Streptomyces hirsutus]|uniref:carbohydrate-binding protein n=1 Tax=Streptomyces hirsutus TaxID=35620 RepID=UPI0006E2F142|nr:carbohydrate-binding protein [Streptomyces hirsutus]